MDAKPVAQAYLVEVRPPQQKAAMSVSQSVSASVATGAGIPRPVGEPPLATDARDVPGASGELDALGGINAPGDHPLDRPLAVLKWSDPFHWLALGWRDFTHAPLTGLFYGACFAAMGWGLLAVFRFAAAYTLALSASFLLLGPFLCLGLYQVSRTLEAGRPVSLWSSMGAWQRKGSAMATFGFILLIIEMLWGRSAMIVFAVSFDGIPEFNGSIAQLLSPEYLPFVATYLAVGALFGGLIFAISAISIPMILDQQTDAISAGLTSLRLVMTQPGVMWLWAALLSVVVVAGMAPGFLGLLVVGPVVGHASWHAYRAATTPA
jgi:uncharacterized membrane protein